MSNVKASKPLKSGARAGKKKRLGKKCPGCGEAMVATKVMAGFLPAGTYTARQVVTISPVECVYWICSKCGHRERVLKRGPVHST